MMAEKQTLQQHQPTVYIHSVQAWAVAGNWACQDVSVFTVLPLPPPGSNPSPQLLLVLLVVCPPLPAASPSKGLLPLF
jgi:hypothetical protein